MQLSFGEHARVCGDFGATRRFMDLPQFSLPDVVCRAAEPSVALGEGNLLSQSPLARDPRPRPGSTELRSPGVELCEKFYCRGQVMSRENRKHPRRQLERAAWIKLGNGSTILCMIGDISE